MMDSTDVTSISIRLLLGAALLLVLLLAMPRIRRYPFMGRWMDARPHYVAAGCIVGFLAPSAVGDAVRSGAEMATYLLLGWVGLTLGIGLDQRTLHRALVPRMLIEGLQTVGVGGVALVLLLGAEELVPQHPLNIPAMIAFAGMCAALTPGIRSGPVGRQGRRRAEEARFLFSSSLGVVVAGVGSLFLRPGGAWGPVLRAGGGYASHDPGGQIGACLLLGAATGVLLDLATRGVGRRYLLMLIVAGLAVGSGTGVALGLEPSWIGFVGGAWWINSTLRRREVLCTVERTTSLAAVALYGIAGWCVGDGLARYGFAVGTFAGCMITVCLARPVGVWAGSLAARRLVSTGWVEIGRFPTFRGVSRIGDVTVALALGLAGLSGGKAGAALLAGVLISQWIISMASGWTGSQAVPAARAACAGR